MNVSRERGFALLIVLWAVAGLALLITALAATGRGAVQLAENLRDGAQARAVADGAVQEAIFHVLSQGGDHWQADGAAHGLGGVVVEVQGLDGKINPNQASTPLLAAFWQACGAAPAQAREIAQAVIDWRSAADVTALLEVYRRAGLPYGPPGRKFGDLAELGDVMGMTPDLLARAMPEMSLDQPIDPDPADAGPLVRQALILAGQSGSIDGRYNGAFPVVEIMASVRAGKVMVRRQAVVSLAAAGAPVPFQIISLADGSAP